MSKQIKELTGIEYYLGTGHEMILEETKASLNRFLKQREERIKNMTLAEARNIVGSIYGHSDMRMESDKALQMLLDCADKTLEQGDVLEKIKAEIEQLRLHKTEFLTSDHRLCIDSQKVLDIIDKYRAESEGEE